MVLDVVHAKWTDSGCPSGCSESRDDESAGDKNDADGIEHSLRSPGDVRGQTKARSEFAVTARGAAHSRIDVADSDHRIATFHSAVSEALVGHSAVRPDFREAQCKQDNDKSTGSPPGSLR